MTRTAKEWKSSREARRLIRATVKRTGSQRAAAKALGLPTHAQLAKMLAGEIRDTPAMRAALARADTRARRAWFSTKDDGPAIDADLVLAAIGALERELETLKSLVRR